MSDPLKKLVVTGLGTGYLPVAPGTWGSAAAAGVLLGVAFASGGRMVCVTGTAGVLAVAATLACGRLGRWTEATFGAKDPGRCTLDEWAGQSAALLLMPLGPGPREWLVAAGVAFVAFRFFDIVKPPPVRNLEALPHGWGIAADDLAAGLYANVVTRVVMVLAFGVSLGG